MTDIFMMILSEIKLAKIYVLLQTLWLKYISIVASWCAIKKENMFLRHTVKMLFFTLFLSPYLMALIVKRLFFMSFGLSARILQGGKITIKKATNLTIIYTDIFIKIYKPRVCVILFFWDNI